MAGGFPGAMVLRPATAADCPSIKALVWRVLREFDMEPDPDHADKGLDNVEAAFDGGGLWLLMDGEQLIGTVGLVHKSADVCELTKMFLHPEWRGRGLGRKLLAHAFETARANGYGQMELETATTLSKAVSLYTSAGFAVSEEPNSVSRCNMVMRLKL